MQISFHTITDDPRLHARQPRFNIVGQAARRPQALLRKVAHKSRTLLRAGLCGSGPAGGETEAGSGWVKGTAVTPPTPPPKL